MQSSFQILQSTQIARIQGAPLGKARSVAAGKEAYLEGVRQRNAVLDWLFYDVGVVAHSEAIALSPWLAAEGAILFVPPTGAGQLEVCASIDEFAAAFANKVHTVAVAGVGSSALGAAAFARNVADAIGEPVSAVVSDEFGALDSRWDLGTEVTVPFAWHHTNTELPMHLPVTETLRKLPEIEKL